MIKTMMAVPSVIPPTRNATPTPMNSKDSQKMVDLLLRLATPLKDGKAYFRMENAEQIRGLAAVMGGNAAGDYQKALTELWSGLLAERRAEYDEKAAKLLDIAM